MSEKISQQEIENLLRSEGALNDTEQSSADKQEDYTQNRKVDIKPVFFESFEDEGPSTIPANIDMILDIPLQVTVELGRTSKSMEEILRLGVGSVMVLDKLAGEPVDILVNGKIIAQGEVVVIDENFGVRITDIISPSGRIAKKID